MTNHMPLKQKCGLFAVMFLLLSAASWAIPVLQLDIDGGTYVGVNPNPVLNESTVTDADMFTIGAIFTPGGNISEPANEYYLAIAITNLDGSPVSDIGTGTLDAGGLTLGQSDLTYGTPSGLPSHGVYSTSYYLLAFNFDSAMAIDSYNVEDDPGYATLNASGDSLLMEFAVDVSALGGQYLVAFDLFTTDCAAEGRGYFAPFSHNAASEPGDDPIIPEPASLALAGLGLAALGGVRRRRRS